MSDEKWPRYTKCHKERQAHTHIPLLCQIKIHLLHTTTGNYSSNAYLCRKENLKSDENQLILAKKYTTYRHTRNKLGHPVINVQKI